MNVRFVQDHVIEAFMDDDVQSDEEILANALRTCQRDVYEASQKRRLHGLQKIVNNCEIERRVRNPDLFDRNGKFNAYPDQRELVHPSLNVVPVFGYSQSVPMTGAKYH
jgi:hypothetical protein